jgi:hypothetical protein
MPQCAVRSSAEDFEMPVSILSAKKGLKRSTNAGPRCPSSGRPWMLPAVMHCMISAENKYL